MIRRYLLALGAPCFPTWNALDIIPNDFPLYAGRVGTYGGEGFNQAFQECDLLLALGSRISGRITAGDVSTFLPHAKVIVVNNDRPTLDDIQARIGCIDIQADVGTFLLRLNELIAKEPAPDWCLWLKHCLETRTVNDPVRDHFARSEILHPYHVVREISKATPSNAIIIGDCGGNLVITAQAFKFKLGQKFITSNGNSPMGFSLAGAIGAHYAAPERPIVCIIGDGGLSINLQELWTVASRRLPIKIVLINNGIYGITDQYQRTNFPDRPIGSRAPHYTAPNFLPLFKEMSGYGAELYHVDDIGEKIRKLFYAADRPFLLDIKCPGFANYLPRTKGRSISELELP